MGAMQFFSDERLGPTQHRLPSGSLLVRNVVVGRTGIQRYHPHEIGLNDIDEVDVHRDPSEVFDPDAMASFEGAPVVLRHPADDEVGPGNWRGLAVGHMQNVRQGDPPDDDKLIADLIVHDGRAIDLIRNRNWRAISLGYQAEYRRDGGRLRQVNIRGNHAAILSPEEEPRCGDACMIADAQPKRRPTVSLATMSGSELDALLARAFPKKRKRARDQSAVSGFGAREYPSSEQSEMGASPDPTAVGAEMMFELPDDRFRYFVSRSNTGRVALFRHRLSEAEGTATTATGRSVVSADARALMRTRATEQKAAMTRIADANRQFWKTNAA
jgi:uncharacterized protein